MLQNAIRAAKLDVDFYNTVEADDTYTGQAGLLVLIVSILTGIGIALSPGISGFVGPLFGAVVAGLVGWVVWAAITDFVGRTFFGGQTNMGEMLRVLGYAQAPRALGIIPFLGWIGAIWALVASVVAIREGQDFSTGKAIGTVIVGWIAAMIASAIVYWIF